MPTKMQQYSNALYADFLDNSEVTVINGKKINVWKGFIGKTCRKLNIPEGMDSRIFKPLETMGCITLIQKGVGSYETVLALHYPPTEDVWEGSDVTKPLTQRRSYARLISSVENIEKQLGGVNIGRALSDLDARVKALESKSK